MKALILSITLILLFASSCRARLKPHELQITNIANEGFLLETSTKKILIDALFTEGYGVFSVPAKEVTDSILESKSPFNAINALFLTHYHADHCNSLLINDYLSKHPGLPFVTTRPCITFIDGNCFGFIGKKKQFVELTPLVDTFTTKTINGLPVKGFGIKHLSFYNKDSVDLEECMYNLAFKIEMDGIRIFHSGDIERASLEQYESVQGKWKEQVDIAFLYYNLFQNGLSDLNYIIDAFRPKYIVLTHIPPLQMDDWAQKMEELKTRFPNVLFFRNSMETKKLNLHE